MGASQGPGSRPADKSRTGARMAAITCTRSSSCFCCHPRAGAAFGEQARYGALAGAHFGHAGGREGVLAFDMGGSTAKMAIIEGFDPPLTWGVRGGPRKAVPSGSGFPIQIAAVELVEIEQVKVVVARRGGWGHCRVWRTGKCRRGAWSCLLRPWRGGTDRDRCRPGAGTDRCGSVSRWGDADRPVGGIANPGRAGSGAGLGGGTGSPKACMPSSARQWRARLGWPWPSMVHLRETTSCSATGGAAGGAMRGMRARLGIRRSPVFPREREQEKTWACLHRGR